MNEDILKCGNHIVICGLGATASQIIQIMETSGENGGADMSRTVKLNLRRSDYVVIDQSRDSIEKALRKWPEMLYIEGDATDDNVLEQARVGEAFGIFPVLSSEKDNLYITMAARQLNPGIRIVSRTADMAGIGKWLFKAGADSVISPNMLGGLRMVSEISRPHVTDFLDELMHAGRSRAGLEEITVSSSSPVAGLSLKEMELPRKVGLNIIAVRKTGEAHYTYNPTAGMKIEEGDILVVMGGPGQVENLKRVLNGLDCFSETNKPE